MKIKIDGVFIFKKINKSTNHQLIFSKYHSRFSAAFILYWSLVIVNLRLIVAQVKKGCVTASAAAVIFGLIKQLEALKGLSRSNILGFWKSMKVVGD